jgi:hypothetical protein
MSILAAFVLSLFCGALLFFSGFILGALVYN